MVVATVATAFAQGPSPAFRDRALAALKDSPPTPAAGRWNELLKSRPQALLNAIAAAERKGWKSLGPSLYVAKGKARNNPAFVLRPVALQEWFGASGGEMLVWEWEDGDETTIEGTVWVRSYSNDNQATFNVQIAGETYESLYETYDETVDAAFNDAPPSGAPAPPPAPVLDRRIPILGTGVMLRKAAFGAPPQRNYCEYRQRQCEEQEQRAKQNRCNYEFTDAGAGCVWRENARRLREQTVGTAVEMGLGAAAGWRACPGHLGRRLACLLGGAGVAAADEMAGQIAQQLADNLALRCYFEARYRYDGCMAEPINISYCMYLSGCSPQPAEATPNPILRR